MCVGLMVLCGLLSLAAMSAEPMIDFVEVKTRAPANPLVKVWYRVPRTYDSQGGKRSRVLVLFGGRNCDGMTEVSGKYGWTEWADLNGIFLVAPTLKDDAYWEPTKWSGRALCDALDALAEKYHVATSGLLFYGYSAGSQASNLFPVWRPDLCRAYVSHACGVFHTPTTRMKDVSGLVTCGDADTARYVISRQFVDHYRQLGVPVVWKSFPNHSHDVPPDSIRLAKEFLAHHHWMHLEDLDGSVLPQLPVAAFVGDDADGVYFPSGSAEADGIMAEDCVELPSETVAAAWGISGRRAIPRSEKARISIATIRGVEVVMLVPEEARADARIVVLCGGRGWTGKKAIRELGFERWAIRRGWCLIAPSFTVGSYWAPQSGSADVVRSAVETVCRKNGIRQLPVFLFGYSAGAQLVALLQSHNPSLVAAWAVYGCGVFPENSKAGAPGFVSCGINDDERFRISREFVYRSREVGGFLLWKPTKSGHELNADALELARLFFAAIADGSPCMLWGEDDTLQIHRMEDIDIEFRNPLYNSSLANRWKREAATR